MPAILVTWLNPFENKVISLHPNTPAHENNHLHEKWDIQLISQLLKCGEGVRLTNIQPNGWPATSCKHAVKEKMWYGFFNWQVAAYTEIRGKCHVLPLKQFSGGQSIMHKEPEKDLMFVLACWVPKPLKGNMCNFVSCQMPIAFEEEKYGDP